MFFGAPDSALGAESSAPAGLTYTVAPGIAHCPTRAEFEALLENEVGSNPFTDNPALSLQVDLSVRPEGVAGAVVLSQGTEVKGRRALNSGDCAALVAALALVVGVELDPLAAAQRQRAGAEAALVAPASTEVVQAVPPQKHRGVPDLFLSTGALAVFGVAPNAAAAVGLGLSARWGSWFQAGIEGQGTLPASAYNLSQVLIIPSACATHWSLGLCALLAVGSYTASGSQTASGESKSSSGGYFTPGARFFAEVALNSNLSLVPHADLYFAPIAPPEIIGVYTAPVVNGSIGLALQARIL